MTIETTIKLQPFKTPNFVLAAPKVGKREEGMQEPPKFRLAECSAETLDKLCDQFRKDIFEKAGKADPKPQYVPAKTTKGVMMASITASLMARAKHSDCKDRQIFRLAAKHIQKLEADLAGYVLTHKADSDHIASLEQDAARYRYLRERDLDTIGKGGIFAGITPENTVVNGIDLDHEIDKRLDLERKKLAEAEQRPDLLNQ